MSSPAKIAADLMAELGATFTELGGPLELKGDVEAPPGRVWAATGTHFMVVHYHTNRPAGWVALTEDMRAGLADCAQEDCDMCHGLACTDAACERCPHE